MCTRLQVPPLQQIAVPVPGGSHAVSLPHTHTGTRPENPLVRHAYPVAVGRVHVVRVHRHRSGELHAHVGPGQEERACIRAGHGRVQVDGHAHLHLQTGPGERLLLYVLFVVPTREFYNTRLHEKRTHGLN